MWGIYGRFPICSIEDGLDEDDWDGWVRLTERETEHAFIADLVVGVGCGQINSGAPARGEHVTKDNRLIEIAAADPSLSYGLTL